MAYCTEADIERMLHNVEHLKRGEEFDVSAQIAAAESWIEAYLEAAGLEVPITGIIPTFIRDAVANYTCYLLVRRINQTGAFDGLMGEFRREAHGLRDDFISGLADVPGEVRERENVALPSVVNPHV